MMFSSQKKNQTVIHFFMEVIAENLKRENRVKTGLSDLGCWGQCVHEERGEQVEVLEARGECGVARPQLHAERLDLGKALVNESLLHFSTL